MGSVWRRLGSDVTLFESQPELLAGADRQVAMEAQKQLTRQGLTILTGATVRKVRRMPKGVAIEYDDARGQVEKAVFDKLLVSIGRVPHTQGLGIETVSYTHLGLFIINDLPLNLFIYAYFYQVLLYCNKGAKSFFRK